ncbi:hypothetical protein GTP41_04830 [Pseudoduganella sp. DS3]|uniref:Uncharacterized protein n=1 Tax=Pseudoduganella guangdongensis TaxID=2692179 RepID=A0A6N9HE34_9BURK|nr:hypothetical protein [Pseudoduganella guangdongensis]MYN01422.1 hypothetical protein [Pseudoduganella guangdongensis]
MDQLTKPTRREDLWTAETVQYGVTLRTIIGLAEAQRYLLSRCVPLHVVERVLSVAEQPRRMLQRIEITAA